MNKMDEQVVVFESRYLPYLDGLPGVAPHHVHQSNISRFGEYVVPRMEIKRRGDVEEDPGYQQVIPYVVVCDNRDNFLMYNRGTKGGEKRLANKWSLGFGGHINREDCPGSFPPTLPGEHLRFLQSAAMRELVEELDEWPTPQGEVAGQPISYEPVSMFNVAFIQIEDTPVDSVHFGVAMKAFCNIRHPEWIKPKSEIAEVKWVSREEIFDYELERWSERLKWHL